MIMWTDKYHSQKLRLPPPPKKGTQLYTVCCQRCGANVTLRIPSETTEKTVKVVGCLVLLGAIVIGSLLTSVVGGMAAFWIAVGIIFLELQISERLYTFGMKHQTGGRHKLFLGDDTMYFEKM
jgi:hypothetical protein